MTTLEKITDITNAVVLTFVGLTHAIAVGAVGLALISAPAFAAAAPGALVQASAQSAPPQGRH